jgi:predicted pyridoxine 5'-phosphate oxidase superfamily flavin-nucleotide-binding protein
MSPELAPPAPLPEVTPAAVPAPHEFTPSAAPADGAPLPGSHGEHLLQCAYGSEERAARFYADQVRDRLLPAMIDFVARMEMVFVATSDGRGQCDASLRAGPAGFIQVLDQRHLAYPEYRGNGVHASLGNLRENPHIGLLMIDFFEDVIGLHINGRAQIVDDAELRAEYRRLPEDPAPGRRPLRWVVVTVLEAYIHCRKHIPRMARVADRRSWGTDDLARKGGDFFGARAERQARETG